MPLDATIRPPKWLWGPTSNRPEAIIDQHHCVLADPDGNIIGRPGPLDDNVGFAKTLRAERRDSRDF